MSSSDDEWRDPPNLLAARAAANESGVDAMLAARRAAVRREREAAALRPPPGPQTTRPTAAPETEPSGHAGVTEETLGSLRRELEAKKKLLAAAKGREEALREWWRSQKAQRLAEIAQLDAKLHQQQEAMEEMKAGAEREVREAEDRQQQRLQEERGRIEAAIREEYEPQIAAQRAKLETLQQEEAKLHAELAVGDSCKDILQKCTGSALSNILQRVEGMFAENKEAMEEWENEVQRLIRHEVRSSFAVTTDSEAQLEREDYQKLFQELLDFWRKAEEEEREHVLKMDDQMLLDMQSMVQDDLDRLQREELSMEEVYVESREAWASQHQELLKRELEASVSRRTAELEEQRTLRHQLHLERIKSMEEKHHDMLEKLRWFHEKQMTLLREQRAKEEHLAERRSCIMAATHADVTRATEEFNRIVHAVEGLLKQIKEYRNAVEDGRTALDADHSRTLEAQEATLTMLKDVVTSQTVSVGEEYNSLSATLSKLEVVRRTVEQHLEEERMWLGKQEAKFANDKTEWEREHRRWKQMVEDEKSYVQERFGRVLAELRSAAEQLSEEEREAQSERASVLSGLRTVSEVATAEVRKLQQREEELQERHSTMGRLLADMEKKNEQVEQQWRQLRQDQQGLVEEKEALREDEGRLRQTNEYLCMLRAQLGATRVEAAKTQEHTNALFNDLCSRQDVVPRRRFTMHPSSRSAHVAKENAKRLPLCVLKELRDMLGKKDARPTLEVTTNARPATPCTLPQQTTQTQQQQSRYVDPVETTGDASTHLYDSSNYNFTCLLNFSDTDSTQPSLNNSA